MKNIIYTILGVCFLVLQSCNTHNTLTIFVDPALSKAIDKASLKAYFHQNLAEHLTNYSTFTVELKLIFETTASAANSRLISYHPPAYDETIFTYEERSSRTQADLYKLQIERSKLLFIDELVHTITALASNSQSSGIAEAIVPISKVQQSSKVILISDLIQDTSAVNLRKAYFEKESEAIILAKQHAAIIKEKFIIPEILYDIELTCLVVSKDIEHPLYPYLERYWSTYFNQFDVNVEFKVL